MSRRTLKIRVLVIEDHPLTAQGLVASLRPDPAMDILGVADTGVEGIRLAKELRPDVVVLDLHLPDIGGIGILQELRRDAPEIRSLIVTASEQAEHLLQAVAAGAAGYLTKRASPEEVRQAVITVHGGGSVISPLLAAHLLREYTQAVTGEGGATPLLTTRETDILRLLAQGHTDREISRQLHLSTRTVQNHLAHVRQKTGLYRRSQLARWAGEHAV
jgi:DNA-binding NarL/FixJ family response regulator